VEQVEHHSESGPSQSQNQGGSGLQAEPRSEQSRTLGGVAFQEGQDSRRSRTLGKVALGAQPDPSWNDYGETNPELASSGRASNCRVRLARGRNSEASKV
jgi:hypothetical protein